MNEDESQPAFGADIAENEQIDKSAPVAKVGKKKKKKSKKAKKVKDSTKETETLTFEEVNLQA